MSSDADCWNSSTATMMNCESDSQLASGLAVKAEPADDDSGSGYGFHQFQSADSREGEVDFKCDFTYEAGSSADPVDSAESTSLNSISESEKTGTLQLPIDLRTSLPKSAKTSGAKQSANTSGVQKSAKAKNSGPQNAQDKSYQCQRCAASFLMYSFLKQHMASSHGERLPDESAPLSTPEGHGSVDTETKAGDIQKSVEREKSRAEINFKTYDWRADVERGRRRHVCDVCSAAFTKASHLKRHKMIHDGDKHFVCEVCNKPFNEPGNLKKHLLIHAGDKQFACDVCGKAFIEAGNLRQHKMIHTGLKPFVCDICNKAFTQSGSLKTHKLIHSGNKKFKCDECNKAFTRPADLKTHKVIHTGLKDFVCDVCKKGFMRADHLKTHKLRDTCRKRIERRRAVEKNKSRTVEKDKSQAVEDKSQAVEKDRGQEVCDVCRMVFTNADDLEIHKMIHTSSKKPFM